MGTIIWLWPRKLSINLNLSAASRGRGRDQSGLRWFRLESSRPRVVKSAVHQIMNKNHFSNPFSTLFYTYKEANVFCTILLRCKTEQCHKPGANAASKFKINKACPEIKHSDWLKKPLRTYNSQSEWYVLAMILLIWFMKLIQVLHFWQWIDLQIFRVLFVGNWSIGWSHQDNHITHSWG